MIYEIVAILSPKLTDEDLAAEQGEIQALIESQKGTVVKVDTWGRRELAYKIGPFTHGVYVQYDLELTPNKVQELEERLRRRENVIRFLLVKKEAGMRSLSDFQHSEGSSDASSDDSDDNAAANAKDLDPTQVKTASSVDEDSGSEEDSVKDKAGKDKVGMEQLDKKIDDVLEEEVK